MLKLYACFYLLIIATGRISGQADALKNKYPDYWSKDREYIFNGLYIDSTGELISSENITLHPTGEIWEADPKQTLMDFTFEVISTDWSRIPVVPLNGIQRSWVTNYKEGVLQTSNKVWMHPIRKNQYILTELAPFPEIILPIKVDTAWSNTLWIYKAFGTFEGTVESTYSIREEEKRTYRFGELKCWKIIATGVHDKLGINSVVFYFNDEIGFTEMNYTFFNKQKIEFKLISVKK